jgi:hypothetical protein
LDSASDPPGQYSDLFEIQFMASDSVAKSHVGNGTNTGFHSYKPTSVFCYLGGPRQFADLWVVAHYFTFSQSSTSPPASSEKIPKSREFHDDFSRQNIGY